jgi:Predicted permease
VTARLTERLTELRRSGPPSVHLSLTPWLPSRIPPVAFTSYGLPVITETRLRLAVEGEPEPTPLIDRSAALLGVAIVALTVFRAVFAPKFGPEIRSWTTVFLAVVLQALPFLVLGVAVSGAVAVFLSPTILERIVPKNVYLGVPAAALAGIALPGCECASAPVSARLMLRVFPVRRRLRFLSRRLRSIRSYWSPSASRFRGSGRWSSPVLS